MFLNTNCDANTQSMAICYLFAKKKKYGGIENCLLVLLSRGLTSKQKGYMGHLTNVANSIVQSVEKGKNKAALDATFSGEY